MSDKETKGIDISPVEGLRATDFVVFEGVCKDGTKNAGKPYKFARIDKSCRLMNSASFCDQLKANGAAVIGTEQAA